MTALMPDQRTPDHDEPSRLPPSDIDAERAILCGCMLTPTAITHASEHITGRDFYRPQHQQIWNALITLAATGAPTDPIAVVTELRRRGTTIDPLYVADIYAAGITSPASTGYYAQRVAALAARRRLIETGTRLVQQAHTTDDDNLGQIRAQALAAIDEHLPPGAGSSVDDGIIPGGTFILDQPDTIEAVWGRGDEVLWARGETLIIAGPQGVGKTTLAQQLALAAVGLTEPHILGYPVTGIDRVLYLCMDRPRQVVRSIRRMVTEPHRATLDERIGFRPGPLPGQLIEDQRIIADMARRHHAGLVIIDSVKDTAVGIAKDDVGAAVNLALQHCLADGVEVLALHHNRKADAAGSGKEPAGIDDIYGSTWITSGAGSVLSLWGQPGDAILNLKHLKQPAGDVGPYKIRHNQEHGTFEIWHGVDVLDVVRGTGIHGLSAMALAVTMFGTEDRKPTDSEKEKARRKLDGMVRSGLLVRRDATQGRQARYFLAVDPATGEITEGV